MTKILCVGDLLLDVTGVLQRSIQPGVETRASISTQGGGAAANVASWLAVNGVDATVIARIGDDAAGRTLTSELDLYGVKYAKKVIPGANTGVVMILIDQNGERTMFPDSGANAGLGVEDLPELDGFDAVYISGYSLINPLSRQGTLEIIHLVKSHNLPVIFDPSTVGLMSEVGIEKTREWLSLADIVIMNEEEAHYVTEKATLDDAIEELLTLANVVVIKRGSDGAVGCSKSENIVSLPATKSHLVSTVGAGDSFAAGFIKSWFSGGSLRDALQSGADIAAECVSLVGSRPLLPPVSNL